MASRERFGKRKALGLGKPLALDFAREFLPDDLDEVRYIFSKRGAYRLNSGMSITVIVREGGRCSIP